MPASSTRNRGSFGAFRKPASNASFASGHFSRRAKASPSRKSNSGDWSAGPFARPSGGPDRKDDLERMLENRASERQSEEKSHGLLGDCQQHPIALRPPFLF